MSGLFRFEEKHLAISDSLNAKEIIEKLQILSNWLETKKNENNIYLQALYKNIANFNELINRYYSSNINKPLKTNFSINQTEYQILNFLVDCVQKEQNGFLTYDKQKYENIKTMLNQKKWTPLGYAIGAAGLLTLSVFSFKIFSSLLIAAIGLGAACPPLLIVMTAFVAITALILFAYSAMSFAKALEARKESEMYSPYAETLEFFNRQVEPKPPVATIIDESDDSAIIPGIPVYR